MKAVVQEQRPRNKLLGRIAAVLVLSVDDAFRVHRFEPLVRKRSSVLQHPDMRKPLVERHACSELVGFESRFAPITETVVFKFCFLTVLQVGIVGHHRGAQIIIPTRFQPQGCRSIAPAEPVFCVIFLVLHVVVARIDAQRKRMIPVNVISQFPRYIVETVSYIVIGDCKHRFGKEVAGRNEVGTLIAFDRPVEGPGQRQGSHRERLAVIQSVALACANLRQGRKPGPVGG